jgi:uncharacterized UPF0160 family protein
MTDNNVIPDIVQNFINLYIENPTWHDSQFGEACNVARQTINAWKHKYKPEIDDRFDNITKNVNRMAEKAIELIINQIESKEDLTPSDRIKLDAAKDLLDRVLPRRSDITSGGSSINVNFGVEGTAEVVAPTGKV